MVINYVHCSYAKVPAVREAMMPPIWNRRLLAGLLPFTELLQLRCRRILRVIAVSNMTRQVASSVRSSMTGIMSSKIYPFDLLIVMFFLALKNTSKHPWRPSRFFSDCRFVASISLSPRQSPWRWHWAWTISRCSTRQGMRPYLILRWYGYLRHDREAYKFIFTSPTSAQDICSENDINNQPRPRVKRGRTSKAPTRGNVASLLGVRAVTARSIAYVAVQVRLSQLPPEARRQQFSLSFDLHYRVRHHGMRMMAVLAIQLSTTTSLTSLKTHLALELLLGRRRFSHGGQGADIIYPWQFRCWRKVGKYLGITVRLQ